jgi:hypothetical protein
MNPQGQTVVAKNYLARMQKDFGITAG